MRGVRAQVTMFFIIGLVLLFTAAILYAITRDTAEPQHADTTPDVLNSYISTCVDSVVEEQLVILGRTGGLWPEHGDGYEFGTVNGQQVVYGITANALQEGEEGMLPYAYDAPQYPDWGVRTADTAVMPKDDGFVPMTDFQDGYFGDVTLPAVCRTGCRHHLGVPGSSGIKIESEELPADEALALEITRGISQCINPQRFESGFIGADVQIVRQPTVDVQLTQHAVLVNIDYSLTVDGTLHDITFDPRYGVRYLAIAQFAHDLARTEAKDVNFNPLDHTELPSYRSGFTVSQNPHVATEIPSTLISIRDESSRLKNEQYEFRFLVQHRRPMLDWIDQDRAVAGSCAGIAQDPDDQTITCDWRGTTFFVTDGSSDDCLQFNDDGTPMRDAYRC